ncbi:DNA-binding protein [Cryobacterium sp. TMT1-21]|nr:DNA-binding protein [Cryobacterium sp. TMT1-21]
MRLTLIQRIFIETRWTGDSAGAAHDAYRPIWVGLEHLRVMNTERLSLLGLELLLTTSELADYLGVQVQAIYDLRTDGRGPSGLRVGWEIRYRVSDVLCWLDDLHEPSGSVRTGEGAR